ncbi:MAG: hypothetical protein J0M10_14150 [Chitinophagales bacterium]|nr:hypothetical protein [Chitinophagales bacterium]
MKPTYILFLAVILFFSFSYKVSAQQPTFNWSQPFTSKGNFRFAGLIDSQLVVIQSRAGKEVVVRRFSPSLAVTTETVQTFASPETPASYLISFVSDSGLVHTLYQYDRKKDLMTISTDWAGRIQVLAAMKAIPQSFVYAIFSADRSKLLVCNFYYHRKTNMVEREFIVLSSSAGQVLYSGSFRLNSREATSGEIKVDNLGNAYFGSTTYRQAGSKLSAKSIATQHVTVFSASGRSVAYSFEYPGRYVPGIDIIQEKNNAVYIAGLAYDEEVKATRISTADLFLYRIDPVRLIYTDSVYITVNGLYPEGKLKKDDRLPYTIRHIYEKTTGGLVLIAEQYQQISTQYSTSEKYHDIACIQTGKDQRSGSVVRIPKFQFDTDNPSILSAFIQDTVYLLYNDLQENLHATGESTQYVSNKKDRNGLFLVTIGKDFQYKKELLYGYDSGQPMPVLLAATPIDNRRIFLCSDEQVGVLMYDDK